MREGERYGKGLGGGVEVDVEGRGVKVESEIES